MYGRALPTSMVERRLRDSPTLVLLAAMAVVFACKEVLLLLAGPDAVAALFALSTPVTRDPWTVLTSVLAHGGPGHLLGNAVLFAVLGALLERDAPSGRFYAFFFGTGALAGLAQVWFGDLAAAALNTTTGTRVWGASGAVFALLGYLLTSNRLTDRVVGSVALPPRVQLLAFGAIAVAVTVWTGGPGVALVAHFTGLLLGLLAGRAHLLRAENGDPDPAEP